MNTDEQSLIDGLFARLKQAESQGSPRDPQADERIQDHLREQPAAAYYMAQAILVQEAALKRMDEQNQQLKAELATARQNVQATPAASGGFLSSIFGGSTRETASPPPAPAQGGGGWREPGRSVTGAPIGQPQNYAQPPQYAQPAGQPYPGQAPAGGGFLRGALQTAAGVAGGVMLAEGISSLFHHNQPQEIVEVLREEPSPAAETASHDPAPDPVQDAGQQDWGNDDSQRYVSNDDYGSDTGGFGGGFDEGGGFGDDDSFV